MQKPSGIDQIPDPSGASEFLRIADHWHEDSGSSRNQNATERALRESEDRYRLLVDPSLAGTLVTRGAETLFASRRLAEIFGYDIDEFNSLHSIYEIVAPADRERLKRYEESRLIGKPAPDRYEFQGLRKDGAPIWVEISVGIVPGKTNPRFKQRLLTSANANSRSKRSTKRRTSIVRWSRAQSRAFSFDWEKSRSS